MKTTKRLWEQLLIWLHIKSKSGVNKYNTIEYKVKYSIKTYFDGFEFDYQEGISIQKITTNQLGITDIKVTNKKSKIIVIITLLRPGLLIGKGGCEIDALTKYLFNRLEKDVDIHIVESKLWE